MNATVVPTLTPEQFFRLLWPNADDPATPIGGHINIWQLQGRSSTWVDVQDIATAATTVARQARRHDVYAATALIDLDARKRQAASENGDPVDPKAIRGTSATAGAIPGVWLDLDVGGPEHGRAHKSTKLPPTYGDALALIAEAMPLEPTIIIDSGHGLYAWWLFAEPWQLDTEQDREEAAALVYRLQRTFQERARAHGWEIDGTGDLARVLRPPRSINHKLAPVPVRAIEVNETRRYQPSDFDQYLLDVEWHSVVAEPVSLPGDLEPVDLDALPLPPYIKQLIRTGNEWQEDRNAWRYGSRSQAVWRVVNEGLKANLGHETIASILLDTRFAISENPLEKGKRARPFVAREIAKAQKLREREAYRASETSSPPVVVPAAGEPQTYEEAMAELARMRRVALDQSDQLEDCRAVLAKTRAERDEAVETVRGISNILAQPKEHMADDFKVFTIQTILEAHSRASRDVAKLPSVVLEERTGQKKNKISDHIQDLAARAGSPIRRHKTREWRTNADGIQEPITVSLVRPLHATVQESLAAVLTMGGPSTKAAQKRQGDRERAAKARGEWGHCPSCDNDTVAVTGKCPTHGKVVGETIVRREDFRILNPEIRESGPRTGVPVPVVTKGHEVRESAAQPLDLLAYAAERPKPWRCHCGSLERYPRPGGGYRCDGCGEVTLPAIMGGET